MVVNNNKPNTSRMQLPSLFECGPLPTRGYCGPRREDGPPPSRGARVRSLVDGIISPFMACVQPPLQSCVAPEARSWDTAWDHHRARRAPEPISPSFTPAPSLVEHPHQNDVLCGRGGSSNRHVGNLNFRELIAANKPSYSGLTKKQKMLMARQIVNIVHNTDPPGRFLARDVNSGYFYDVGIPRSLEKTSQALREKSNTASSDALPEQRQAVEEAAPSSPQGAEGTGAREQGKTVVNGRHRKVETPPIIIPPNLASIYRVPSKTYLQSPVKPDYNNSNAATSTHAVVSPPLYHLQTPALSEQSYPPTRSAVGNHLNGRAQFPPFRPLQPVAALRPRHAASFAPTVTPSPSFPSYPAEPPSRLSPPILEPDWKRQKRNLSHAVQSQLSLEERVVRPPRDEIVSPSNVIQSRHHSRAGEMDGLAALSTAAFLRLDDTD